MVKMENYKIEFLFSQFDKYLLRVCYVGTLSWDCGKTRKGGKEVLGRKVLKRIRGPFFTLPIGAFISWVRIYG